MDYISVNFLSAVIATLLISSTKGSTLAAVPGENKVIQWQLNRRPGFRGMATIIHPSGGELYSALGHYKYTMLARVAKTGLGKRVSNIRNTDDGHIEFTLDSITMDDSGDYRAKYVPIDQDGQDYITRVGVTLVVYAKPSRPSITEIRHPVVNRSMILSCVTQSNSKPDNKQESLQMTYLWYIDGADLPNEDRYVTSGSQLEVKNVQKTDRDTIFTCQAYETMSLMSDVSAGYSVTVQYGPDAVFPDAAQQYSLVENDKLGPITCNADCVPECTYHWVFENSMYIGRYRYDTLIGHIERNGIGTYWCVASNAYGTERSKNITVTILYGPEVTSISPSDSSYTRLQVTDNTLGPITCIADCYPGCTFQWFRNGQVVSSSADLTLTSITRSDQGTYLCRAYNDYGGMNSTSFNLKVRYGQLLEDILKSQLMNKYNADTIPLLDPTRDNVTVQMSMSLISIVDFSNNVLTLDAWMHYEWQDLRLLWNPFTWQGLQKFVIPAKKLWIPEVVLYNSAVPEEHEYTRSVTAVVSYDGKVVYVPGQRLKAYCRYNEASDGDSACELKFGLREYNGWQVDFNNRFDLVDMNDMYPNKHWEITNTTMGRDVTNHANVYIKAVFNLQNTKYTGQ